MLVYLLQFTTIAHYCILPVAVMIMLYFFHVLLFSEYSIVDIVVFYLFTEYIFYSHTHIYLWKK